MRELRRREPQVRPLEPQLVHCLWHAEPYTLVHEDVVRWSASAPDVLAEPLACRLVESLDEPLRPHSFLAPLVLLQWERAVREVETPLTQLVDAQEVPGPHPHPAP